jgi:hypothetical protein
MDKSRDFQPIFSRGLPGQVYSQAGKPENDFTPSRRQGYHCLLVWGK